MVTLAAKWTRLALTNAPSLRLSSHSLAVVKDSAFIFGGELKPRTPVSADLTKISLTDGSTQTLSPTDGAVWPSPRVGAALTEHDGTLYLWGGRGGKDMGTFPQDEDVWSFDTASEAWAKLVTKGDRPEQRSFHVLTALGDTLYLHAGCPPKGRLDTLHSLSLAELTWKVLPSAPGPGRGGTVLAPLLSTKLVRFGGFAGFELGGPIEVFDIKKGEWEQGAGGEEAEGGPGKRSVHALVELKGVAATVDVGGKEGRVVAVMVMGEREGAPAELGHDGAGHFHSDAWALMSTSSSPSTFSASDLSWIPLPPSKTTTETPEARGWFAASAFGGDKVVLQGGLNEKNERLADMWTLEVVVE